MYLGHRSGSIMDSVIPGAYIAISEQGNQTRVGNRMGFVHAIGEDYISLKLNNDVGPGTPLNKQKVWRAAHRVNPLCEGLATNVIAAVSLKSQRA